MTNNNQEIQFKVSQSTDLPLVIHLKKREGIITFSHYPMLLANFPHHLAEKFLSLGEECYYGIEESVITSSEVGRDIYLICEGEVSVYRGKIKLATLRKGDVFGELVIFRDHYRIASIRTNMPSILLKFNRHVIMDFFAHQDQRLFYIYTVNIIEILRRKLILTNQRVCELEERLLVR